MRSSSYKRKSFVQSEVKSAVFGQQKKRNKSDSETKRTALVVGKQKKKKIASQTKEACCPMHAETTVVKKRAVMDASLLTVTAGPSITGLKSETSGADEMIQFVQSRSELHFIKKETMQLSVWQRKSLPSFVTELADPGLNKSQLPNLIKTVRPTEAADKVRAKLLSQKNLSLSGEDIDKLAEDISNLVKTFAEVTETDKVQIRLECLGDDGCRYWHQDCVDYRLVTTYRGPCTEFVYPEHSEATLKRRRHDSKHSQCLTHSDVAFFKGRGVTFNGDPLLNHPGIVHRSPKIDGSGVYRVVLVLDIPSL